MGKVYRNVKEMIDGLPGGEKFKKEAREYIDSLTISTFLCASRCGAGFTQKQMAEKLNCSQGRISKIENAQNHKLSIQDLLDYAKVLGLQPVVGFHDKELNRADQIKYHVRKIKEILSELMALCKEKEDKKIKEGMLSFVTKITANFANTVISAVNDLDPSILPKLPQEPVHIATPSSAADKETPVFIDKPDSAYGIHQPSAKA